MLSIRRSTSLAIRKIHVEGFGRVHFSAEDVLFSSLVLTASLPSCTSWKAIKHCLWCFSASIKMSSDSPLLLSAFTS